MSANRANRHRRCGPVRKNVTACGIVSTSGGGAGGGGQEESVEDNLEKLADLIKNTIEPESWDDNGGRGTIRIFRRSLVIRNSIEVHEKIGGPVYDEDF